MNKTNQFSAQAQYVTPRCKSVELRSASTILTGSNQTGRSYDERQNWDGRGGWVLDED